MKLCREDACWYAHCLEENGFRASAYDTGERINNLEVCQIRVWVDGKIKLLRTWFDYINFRHHYIVKAHMEHHQAVWALIDSVSDPGDDWRQWIDKLGSR